MLLAALLIAAYCAVGVFDHDIWAPTEPAVAGVTWEITPKRSGRPPHQRPPYLEKPPLYYWAAWACCKIGGRISAGLLRLPALAFGSCACTSHSGWLAHAMAPPWHGWR